MITNWQYDDMKEALQKAVNEGGGTPKDELLYHCLMHFNRYEKWMARLQEALWYTENDNAHYKRKLARIEDIIKKDINND